MNQIAWQIYGGSKAKANTFIGGVASTITTSGALATKLGIASNRITNFKIVGSDIECRIIGAYSIPDNCFISDTSITYYRDTDNLVNNIGSQAFRGCSNFTGELNFAGIISLTGDYIIRGTPISKVILPNCTSIINPAFYNGDTPYVQTAFYIPKCLALGSSALNNQVFFEIISGSIIYANPSLATNNAGAPDGDLAYAISQGAIVRYVTNFTAPNPITNLSVGTIYGTAVQLNFTAPTGSTNAIEFYEIYVNGVYNRTVTASGGYASGLTLNTTYTIEVKPVDIFYNKSTSNMVSATTATTGAPTRGLISFYKLDANSNDIWGSNNGTDTNVSYVAGKIGNAGSYNGTTSKTIIGNPANLQLSTGSVSCWIKTSAAGSSYRAIFSKENDYGLFLVDGVLGFYNWGSFGGSGFKSTGVNLNDNLWHNLVLVFESNTALNYIYIDGVLKLTFSMSVLNQSTNLLIGLNSTSQYINALIDETSIYNTKLTQNEIDLIYNSGNGTTL